MQVPLSRLLPWAAWLWRRPWRGRMADPDSRGVEVPLDPCLARRASLACAGLGRRRREPSLRLQCANAALTLSLSLCMPCVAGTDGGPLGSHTRGWPAALMLRRCTHSALSSATCGCVSGLGRVVAVQWLSLRVVAFPPPARMFIFTKRFSVTPTRNHDHPQLGCITPTDGRVNVK